MLDVMNGNREKGCSNIISPNHAHVFDLLDYVKFLTRWKSQADALNNPNLYFAPSTHQDQDSCWTALSIVILAMRQLPKDVIFLQCRGGTDYLEKTFCISPGKNANATCPLPRRLVAAVCTWCGCVHSQSTEKLCLPATDCQTSLAQFGFQILNFHATEFIIDLCFAI